MVGTLDESYFPYSPLSAQEIATLRKEAQAFNNARAALRSTSPEIYQNAAKLAFQKVRLHSYGLVLFY